jgi:xanthine/CO dehydrogenase XdhC/CoxF family maturation factor
MVLYSPHHGAQEFGLFAGGGVDLLVERVAQGHQLVDAGDDAVLFGEGGQWDKESSYVSH